MRCGPIVAEGFVFDVKPYKQITWHDRKTPPDEENTRAFSTGLQPLREAGKLGAVHCQFPPWFVYRPENVAYLSLLRERFPQDRLGVEFRHQSWLNDEHRDEVVATLAAEQMTLTWWTTATGQWHVPTVLADNRSRVVIVRFMAQLGQWYARVRHGERFDYLYSEQELREWVPQSGNWRNRRRRFTCCSTTMPDYAVQYARQLRLMWRAGACKWWRPPRVSAAQHCASRAHDTGCRALPWPDTPPPVIDWSFCVVRTKPVVSGVAVELPLFELLPPSCCRTRVTCVWSGARLIGTRHIGGVLACASDRRSRCVAI
jgi:uncharacterized protein YecE (DUF72 family)